MDTNDQLFDCLCRTCMHELKGSSYDGNSGMIHNDDGDIKSQQWQSIYDSVEEESCSFRIAELLSQAVPQIELQLSDELPKKICYQCLQRLLSVHRFQQMCLQCEEQLRQQVSKKQTKFSIPATTEKLELETKDAALYPLEHSAIQKPFLESKEQVVKTETVEASDGDVDQLLEDCRDSQGNFSEFIKNEPIEDNEPVVEDSDDGDTIHSANSVKDEALAIECEEQQINEILKPDNTHTRIKREACDICGKIILKYNLKRHKLQLHSDNNEKAHKCVVCDKSFNYFHHLRRHMRWHTGEKPYKCKYCERSFSQASHRIRHMRVHLGGANAYRCEFCPLAFPAAKELRLHLTEHEYEDSDTRERNMKALKEAEAWMEVKLSKNETQQEPKEQSQQQFEIRATETVEKNNIRNGEETNKEKPYECPYCPRKFTAQSTLYQHKQIHEGVKQEDCDICGKSINKYNLKQHKLTHSNEKAYKCDFCGKRFARIWYLRRHIPTHTGEKKYKCKYCERAFPRCPEYLNHMRVHLGANIHRCELCPLGFPLAKELREHLTMHKDEDSETRERNMRALQEAETKLQLKFSKKDTQQSSKEDYKMF